MACLDYGPPDFTNLSFGDVGGLFGSGATPQIFTATEPYLAREFADGAYHTAPMRGMAVWNSHAFNHTDTDSTMSQYLNIEFAAPQDQLYPIQQIFEAGSIFVQSVPPFETREYCRTYTLPQGSRLSELTSHTHLRGVHWRIWGPPQTPCEPPCPPGFLSSFFCDDDPALPTCSGPGDPGACVYPNGPGKCMYESRNYNDPLQLTFEPPVPLDAASGEDRTYLYCSVYDNGSGVGSPPVKRISTTPTPPLIFGISLPLGGPCPDFPPAGDPEGGAACLDGSKKGEKCLGNDSFCDSAPDAGDGSCDACPIRGGVTTEDEMFILLGTYHIP